MSAERPGGSRLVLDQASGNALLGWLLARHPESRVRGGVTVRPEDDHLHVSVQGLDLGAMVPNVDVALDLHLELYGSQLQVRAETHGVFLAAQWLLRKLSPSGSVLLLLLPALRDLEGVRLRGCDGLVVDLACLSVALPDGTGASRKMRLADLVHVAALSVGSGAEAMLTLDFSLV
jgi:hypothetical protein